MSYPADPWQDRDAAESTPPAPYSAPPQSATPSSGAPATPYYPAAVPQPPAPAYPLPAQPGVPYGHDPAAPYGYDPVTGQPLSDKSKVIAGLLQLLFGAFFALGGIGRLYAGHTGVGVAQIVTSVLGWICLVCGAFFILPWFLSAGAWLWFVVDGIVMLAGRSVDGQGRLLRT